MCQMFGCLPSQLMNEDASIFRLVQLYDLARPAEEGVP